MTRRTVLEEARLGRGGGSLEPAAGPAPDVEGRRLEAEGDDLTAVYWASVDVTHDVGRLRAWGAWV